MAKNVVTRMVQPGIMAFDCDYCREKKRDGTAFVSIPIIVYSHIKAWGNKTFKPRCRTCHSEFEVTLTP